MLCRQQTSMCRNVHKNVLSESLLHLPLWLIFRYMHLNLINVRSMCASYIYAHLTKNHLTKSGTERLQGYIKEQGSDA